MSAVPLDPAEATEALPEPPDEVWGRDPDLPALPGVVEMGARLRVEDEAERDATVAAESEVAALEANLPAAEALAAEAREAEAEALASRARLEAEVARAEAERRDVLARLEAARLRNRELRARLAGRG